MAILRREKRPPRIAQVVSPHGAPYWEIRQLVSNWRPPRGLAAEKPMGCCPTPLRWVHGAAKLGPVQFSRF